VRFQLKLGGQRAPFSRIMKRYHELGEVKIAKKSRRPKKLNEYSRRVLVREMCKNRRAPLIELAENLPVPVAIRILRKEVYDLGLSNRVATKKPFF
jgi:hypothetical protein